MRRPGAAYTRGVSAGNSQWWRALVRGEVLGVERRDGALDLVDLLLDRVVRITPSSAAALRAGDPALCRRLDELGLRDSPAIDALRERIAESRLAEPGPPPPAPRIAGVRWSDAKRWPAWVSPAWRDPERLRRLAEDRAAGRRYLMLPQFVRPATARAITRAAARLPFQRFESDLVRADKCLLTGSQLAHWRRFLTSPLTRRIFGGLLGQTLPPQLVINAWRLHPGDGMGVHPDGRLYRATVSLGLCERWTAAAGGAIAFGEPCEDGGFEVRERWLPHLGDLCLFVPSPTTWHRVEPATALRLSVTGWWVTPRSS
jgi:hypothetical protein